MNFDHGGSPGSPIDASVNINPLGAPRSLDHVFARARSLSERYPEPDAARARRAWAEKLGAAAECVLIGNGASELISLTVQVCGAKRVVVFDPCYSEYEAAAASAGCAVMHMPLERHADAWRTPEHLPDVRETDLVIVAQPNNPTGHVTPRRILRHIEATGARLMVDESFLALSEAPLGTASPALESFVPHVRENVCVVASLTKTYCVPGLRLGYLVADEGLVRRISKVREPWNVNGIAAEAAVVLASDDDYVARSRALLSAERRKLSAALAQIPGVRVMDGHAPWVLVELPAPMTAAIARTTLLAAGIAIRDASTFRGLGERWIRVGVRTAEANDRIAAALTSLLS